MKRKLKLNRETLRHMDHNGLKFLPRVMGGDLTRDPTSDMQPCTDAGRVCGGGTYGVTGCNNYTENICGFGTALCK